MEALLCFQILAVHFLATAALCSASTEGRMEETAELYTNRATRLMRLFAPKAELLAKLQGITVQQRVSVEHVQVNSGGQAVVELIGSAAPAGGIR